MKRVHLIISGKVQGVFFRTSAKNTAKRLNLKGFVKNLANEDVEVVAEGPENKLNELVNFCKIGPPGAKVADIKIENQKPKNEFDNFIIKY